MSLQRVLLFAALGLALGGCRAREIPQARYTESSAPASRRAATEIEYPDVAAPTSTDLLATPAPLSLVRNQATAYRDLSLQEAMHVALANAKVLRDLGGQLLRSPQNYTTVYGPAISETDPRFGLDAALSAFDTSFSSSAFYEKNDRALNNQFFGGGTRLLQQDALVLQNQLTKRGATGTQYSVRNFTDYDANNAPGNAFPSAWNSNIETEFRHPLLQGGGVDYNRIAGPGATPGVYNGVLIARINTDVSLNELETGVRGLMSEVENAYWDLYFAYRDLDAKLIARDTALETWRKVHTLAETGRRGGEVQNESHAREQYFRFEEEVQNALAGVPLDGTRMNNGSSGGTFRGNGGVQTADRRLRLLMGMPIVDGELLRPIDLPSTAAVAFDWQPLIAESLARRVELRRQRWLVKRRELELVAAENFLLPQLDAIGRYRWRGFGDDLMGGPDMRFGDAIGTLFGGDFQEWQLGAEFSVPLGVRKGHAAVRNAQWNLSRERALLHEMERQIVHDLGGAVAEADRAYAVVQTTLNRRVAAYEQTASSLAAFDSDQVTLDYLLEAQRLLADADVRYHRAQIEHAIAVKNVHFEAGTLLQYNGVDLAEGPWVNRAYRDVARNSRSMLNTPLNYLMSPGRRVTSRFDAVPAGYVVEEFLAPPAAQPIPAEVEVAPAAFDAAPSQQPEPQPFALPREAESIVPLPPAAQEAISAPAPIFAAPPLLPPQPVELH